MTSDMHAVIFGELLAEPVRTGVYKPKEFHGRGVKIVNMGELFAHPRLRAMPMKRVELSSDELARFELESGDLLFARRSLVAEGAGKCILVLELDGATVFESSIIRARPDPSRADPRYLYYFFNSRDGLHALDTIRRQVAVSGITGTDLSQLEIRIPSLPTQRAIADILTALDDKIDLNRRMNETLETIARAIFESWFVDFDPVRAKMEGRQPVGMLDETAANFPASLEPSPIGDIPAEWPVLPLRDVVDLNPPRALPPGTDAAYLEMSNVLAGSARVANWSRREFKSGTRFVNGDVLLARITPSLEHGKTVYVDYLREGEVGWGSTEFIVMRSRPTLPAEYAYFLARTDEFRDHAIANMTGSSGRQRVPTSCFDTFLVPVPTPALSSRFGELARPLMQRMKANDEESAVLQRLRDALLPKLVSGEIRVQEDEELARAPSFN
jgi:type I restriction enzyme S subunit